MHQYSRAERLLLRPFPENSENSILMSGNDQHEMFDHLDILGREGDRHEGKAKDFGTPRRSMLPDLTAPGMDIAPSNRLPMGIGPSDLISDQNEGTVMLVDLSISCRYLAGLCQIRQGKWAEATEMLGEANPFRGTDGVGPRIANTDGGIKVSFTVLEHTFISRILD